MQVEPPVNSTVTNPPPGIAQTIEMASMLAVETDDYLSFATVLDLYLGNPQQFSNDEATEILSVLLATFKKYPVILYRVGWDLIEQLLKYVDHFSEREVESLPSQRPFLLVMELFSLLCEQGNPRELLVTACELILSTESDENIKKIKNLKLEAQEGALLEKLEQQGGALDLESVDASGGFESVTHARQQNVKFCILFEVIRYSLQRIKTPYPSSFLLEAAQTFLQVADDPNADMLSISTYARRMFLLARDFNMPGDDEVSPEELMRVRNLLVNFVSHTADVVLRRYSLKLTQRLYIQIRNRVALAPPTERDFVYKESEQTRRMTEVISRLAQLLLSYDFDPNVYLYKVLGLALRPDGTLEKSDAVAVTKVEGCEVLADNFWSRRLLQGPSPAGLVILKSQLHFDGSRKKSVSWEHAAYHCCVFLPFMASSAGCRDFISYWALWTISNADEASFANADYALLVRWLETLLNSVKLATSSGERFVAGSMISRLLRLVPAEFAYNFCLDVMKRSSDPSEQYVVVESLKVLLTGKVAASADEQAIEEGTTGKTYTLSSEQKKELTRVCGESIHRLKMTTHSIPFYYLNFLAVVPTDSDELLVVADNLYGLAARCEADMTPDVKASCRNKLGMLRRAAGELKARALEGK